MLSFFPRGVLDEILHLIESVSEGFPSYPLVTESSAHTEAEIKESVRECQSLMISWKKLDK